VVVSIFGGLANLGYALARKPIDRIAAAV